MNVYYYVLSIFCFFGKFEEFLYLAFSTLLFGENPHNVFFWLFASWFSF